MILLQYTFIVFSYYDTNIGIYIHSGVSKLDSDSIINHTENDVAITLRSDIKEKEEELRGN